MKYVNIAATSSNKAIRDFSRKYALVAQWIEYFTPNEGAAGSIPAGRTIALKASTRWNYSILTSAFFILPQFLPQFTPFDFLAKTRALDYEILYARVAVFCINLTPD